MPPKSELPPKIRASRAEQQQHIKALQKAHKESSKIIKNYILGRDIPAWFRGTSNFQGKAAMRLNESLLYDMEQRTSHRVRACLIGLGLNPIVKTDEIKFLIKMSRGNDLAFLWFLYEMHYRASSSSQYSINEQLILSTIAHLDMIPTLRELDRILPPGVKEEPKPPKKTAKPQIIRANDVRLHGKVENVKSPYLTPIRLPKPFSTQNKCERKDFKVTLGEYDTWEDPNYIVHNEANRWFAEYKPRTGERIVYKILKEQIASIFADYENIAERLQNTTVMCEAHRRQAEMEDKLKVEVHLKAREKCKKYFDVGVERKQSARARLVTQLQRDVDMYFAKFKKCAPGAKRDRHCREDKDSVMILKGVDKFLCRRISSSQEHLGQQGSFLESSQNLIGDSAKVPTAKSKEKKRERGGKDENSCDSDSSNENEFDKRPFSINCVHLPDCLQDNNTNNKYQNAKSVRCEEYDEEPFSPCSSNVFFVAAQEHQPWRFDYQKVFQVSHPYHDQEDVKQQAAKSINSEMSFQTRMECLGKPNIDKAVDTAVKRVWRRSVKAFNDLHPKAVHIKDSEEEKISLDFGRDSFDPNDSKLMTDMLKTAFDYIKRNPKFVLAALPEAYKLPTFIYFIENRYGKRYSLRDRQRLYMESLKILRALEKLTKKMPMPNIKQFCTSPFVSYGCRDYLLAKANRIKQDYYEELDNAIMRQARVFWFAMRPYLCTSGPPKNTYFAYMPSRSVDITRYRQWKSTEFMNAKGAWDRRQREARHRIFK